jgi:hypothetical protein
MITVPFSGTSEVTIPARKFSKEVIDAEMLY